MTHEEIYKSALKAAAECYKVEDICDQQCVVDAILALPVPEFKESDDPDCHCHRLSLRDENAKIRELLTIKHTHIENLNGHLASVQLQLAAEQSYSLRLREALERMMKSPRAFDTRYSCWTDAEKVLALPHNTDTLRDFGLNVAEETYRQLGEVSLEKAELEAIVDAVLRGE